MADFLCDDWQEDDWDTDVLLRLNGGWVGQEQFVNHQRRDDDC